MDMTDVKKFEDALPNEMFATGGVLNPLFKGMTKPLHGVEFPKRAFLPKNGQVFAWDPAKKDHTMIGTITDVVHDEVHFEIKVDYLDNTKLDELKKLMQESLVSSFTVGAEMMEASFKLPLGKMPRRVPQPTKHNFTDEERHAGRRKLADLLEMTVNHTTFVQITGTLIGSMSYTRQPDFESLDAKKLGSTAMATMCRSHTEARVEACAVGRIMVAHAGSAQAMHDAGNHSYMQKRLLNEIHGVIKEDLDQIVYMNDRAKLSYAEIAHNLRNGPLPVWPVFQDHPKGVNF